MNLTVVAYIIYLVLSVGLTVWVARTLSRTGLVFLKDVFRDSEELAETVNRLLVIGLYLVNLGFVALWLKVRSEVGSTQGLFEELSVKIGTVLLVLGLLHLGNVFVLNRIRRHGLPGNAPKQPRAPFPPRPVGPAH